MNPNDKRLITAGQIRLLFVFVGLLVMWTVFAKLIVPSIIESAYRGESWPFFNRMIRGQAWHSLQFYLDLWDKKAMMVLLSGLAFSLIAVVISSPAFVRNIVGEATPG